MSEVTKDLIQQAHADLKEVHADTEQMREFAHLVARFQSLQQHTVQATETTLEQLQHSDDNQVVIPMNAPLLEVSQEIAYNQALLVERQRGIQTINRDLQELHELFLDIGTMASTQQLGIDNIEAGLEEAARETSRAVQQLEATRLYRRRRRWTGWCTWPIFWCIILTIIVTMIIISL